MQSGIAYPVMYQSTWWLLDHIWQLTSSNMWLKHAWASVENRDIKVWIKYILSSSYQKPHQNIYLNQCCTIQAISYNITVPADRWLTLACPGIWQMGCTTYPKVEKFQWSGQLQRPFTTRSIPLPAMSGAMAVCSMRFGVSDTNHSRELEITRFDSVIHKID